MKKAVVLGGTFLLLVSLTGCGSNPREDEINKVLNKVANATENRKAVSKALSDALQKADKENKQLTETDLKPAMDTAAKLREIGEDMLKINARISVLKERVTTEQQAELAAEHGETLAKSLNSLQAAEAELDATVAKLEEHATPTAMEKLREALKNSREGFEILTKQQR